MSDADSPDRLKLERLVTFTDAVFAIIMTLLALEIRVPAGARLSSTSEVLAAVHAVKPELSAYAVSFLVVAMLWNVHLQRYSLLRAINSTIVAGNMLQLLLVGLIPFGTYLLGASGSPIAVSLYAGILLVNSLIGWLTWMVAARNPDLVGPSLTSAIRREQSLRSAAVCSVFALSIPVAWISPLAGMLIWVFLVPANTLIGRFRRANPAAFPSAERPP